MEFSCVLPSALFVLYSISYTFDFASGLRQAAWQSPCITLAEKQLSLYKLNFVFFFSYVYYKTQSIFLLTVWIDKDRRKIKRSRKGSDVGAAIGCYVRLKDTVPIRALKVPGWNACLVILWCCTQQLRVLPEGGDKGTACESVFKTGIPRGNRERSAKSAIVVSI